MDQKTKRVIIQFSKNLAKLVSFSVTVIVFFITCLYLSYQVTGDYLYGLAISFLPLLGYSVWDMSKQQVETQIYKEENLIETIKREF